MLFLWIKTLHIIAVISWMAGLLYLPRLMVYHSETEPGTAGSETFKVMEQRLFRLIMTPAMIAVWLFGLWLAHLSGAVDQAWFWVKFFLIIILTAFHFFTGLWVKEFSEDKRKRSSRFFRVANEFPTLIMIAVVILVVVKPF